MSNEFTSIHVGHEYRTSVRRYVVGFGLSLLLTLIPFWMVESHALAGSNLVAVILGIAIAQLLVQAVCFLHINMRASARSNLVVFTFAGLIVFTVVAGSLWIMENLNYNMTAQQMQAYMNSD